MTYKKKYHSKLMEIPQGAQTIDDLIKIFSNKYIYLDMGKENFSSWYHLEDYTRHIDNNIKKKYLFSFYRQITNETMNYHIAICYGLRLRSPVWHKYTNNRPKPKFYYAFWEKPGKYHDYNPGPYDKGAYYFSNHTRIYLQKQSDLNVTDKLIKVNKELYLYNDKFLDIKYKLYNKNMETYKIQDIMKSCYKNRE